MGGWRAVGHTWGGHLTWGGGSRTINTYEEHNGVTLTISQYVSTVHITPAGRINDNPEGNVS